MTTLDGRGSSLTVVRTPGRWQSPKRRKVGTAFLIRKGATTHTTPGPHGLPCPDCTSRQITRAREIKSDEACSYTPLHVHVTAQRITSLLQTACQTELQPTAAWPLLVTACSTTRSTRPAHTSRSPLKCSSQEEIRVFWTNRVHERTYVRGGADGRVGWRAPGVSS